MPIAVQIGDMVLADIVRIILGKAGYQPTDAEAPVSIRDRAGGFEVARRIGPERRVTLAHPVWEHDLLAAVAMVSP